MRRMMFVWLAVCSACSSGGHILNAGGFYDVPVGASKSEVVDQIGSPASSRNLGEGREELEYIERVRVGGRLLQERRYILTLKDGKVVSKRMETDLPAPTQFDSYEMQTTQNFSQEF